jgi:hypothetical protein
MPSVFDRQFSQSAFPALLAQFGEPIVYFFRSGVSKSMYAIVNRQPASIYDAAGNVVTPAFTIRVEANCSRGLNAKEVDTGGDYVQLLRHPSDMEPIEASVMQLVSEDSGVVEIALRGDE